MSQPFQDCGSNVLNFNYRSSESALLSALHALTHEPIILLHDSFAAVSAMWWQTCQLVVTIKLKMRLLIILPDLLM